MLDKQRVWSILYTCLYTYIWGLSNKALLFELVSPAFRGPFAFAEEPRIVISLFHCTEFTVFGISKQWFQGHGWADALPGNAPFRGPTAGLSRPFRENPCFCSGKRMCHVLSCVVMLCTLYVISLGWHMSFAVLSPAFRGLQFPLRDMYVLTFHLNSFTGNNGRPSYKEHIVGRGTPGAPIRTNALPSSFWDLYTLLGYLAYHVSKSAVQRSPAASNILQRHSAIGRDPFSDFLHLSAILTFSPSAAKSQIPKSPQPQEPPGGTSCGPCANARSHRAPQRTMHPA